MHISRVRSATNYLEPALVAVTQKGTLQTQAWHVWTKGLQMLQEDRVAHRAVCNLSSSSYSQGPNPYEGDFHANECKQCGKGLSTVQLTACLGEKLPPTIPQPTPSNTMTPFVARSRNRLQSRRRTSVVERQMIQNRFLISLLPFSFSH